MRVRTIILTLGACLVSLTLGFAEDLNIGTRKLNEAKSKLSPGVGRNNLVVVQAAGDDMKVTIDGVDAQGKPTHVEWTGKFEGKDYPLPGDANWDSRSYKEVDDHATDVASKKGGKATTTGRIVISADGRARTVTVYATDAMGKKIHINPVYEKQ
jgi:hypothetical protein